MKILISLLVLAFCQIAVAAPTAKPELEVQTGHQDQVFKVAISPDGSRAATASADGSVKIWDVATGLQLYSWPFSAFSSKWKGGGVRSVVFSQNGKRLAAAESSVSVFDLDSQQVVLKLKPEFPANHVKLSPDGTRLYFTSHGKKDAKYGASADHPSSITVIEVASGKQLQKWPTHTWMVTAFQISPDGKTLITGSGNKELSFWNADDGRLIKKVQPGDIVQDAVFFPDGKRIAVAVGDKYEKKKYEIQVFDALGNELGVFGTFKSEIRGLALNGDGSLLAAVTREEGLLAFDVATRRQVLSIPKSSDAMYSVAITPDSAYFFITTGSGDITVSGDNALLIFQRSDGKQVKKMRNLTKEALDMAVSNTDQMMVANGQEGARLWDLATGRVVKTFDARGKDINAVDISSDGRVLAYGWNKELGVEVLALNGSFKTKISAGNLLKQVKLSLRGDSVITLASQSLAKWGTSTGTREKTYAFNGDAECNEAWEQMFTTTADGTRMALVYRCRTGANWSSAKYKVALFDVDSGQLLKRIDTGGDELYNISLSPDGKIAFLGGSTQANGRLIDTQSGTNLRELPGATGISSSAFSADGTKLVTGDRNGAITQWDVESAQQLARTIAHTGDIARVIQKGNRYALSASADGKINLWGTAPLALRTTFLSFANQEFATITPDSYYLLSKNGIDGIAFRHKMKAYRYDQFDLKYNRPDKVVASIGIAPPALQALYASAYQKRLKRLKFTEQDLARDVSQLPELSIAGVIPPSVSTPSLSFPIKARDNGNGLSRLHVTVNGVPVAGTSGELIPATAKASFDKTVNVALSPGKNIITVAVQSAGGLRSLEQTFSLNADLPKRKPDVFVLGIGVSSFKQQDYNLTYAAKDTLDLAALYTSNPGGRFGNIKTMNINDQQATRDNILKAKAFLAQSKIDDVVIVHVASHGLLDKDLNYFLATNDIDFNNPGARGLAYEELESLLDGIPSRQKLMLIDACHSGEVDKDDSVLVASAAGQGTAKGVSSRGLKAVQSKSGSGLTNSFEMMKELFSDLQKGTGAVVISSASGKEFAFESEEWKNGVFTYSLLEGLRSGKADLDKNGEISVSELREYAAAQVTKLTNGQQTPSSRAENLETNFRVW